MIHPGLNKATKSAKVKAAVAQYKHVARQWWARTDAERMGYAAYETPLHHAEQELNAAVEEALF